MKTHQPYLFKKNNNRYLLFTKGDAKKTYPEFNNLEVTFESIYVKNLDTNEEKKLFEFQEYVECNPVYFEKNNKKFISFIRSNNLNNSPIATFSLYKVEVDENFNKVNEPELLKENTYSGFENENYIIFSEVINNRIILVINYKQENFIKRVDISGLLSYVPQFRVIPVFDNKSALILTSALNEKTAFIKDLNNFYDFKLMVNKNNEPIYKCSFLDNLLVYAIKIGPNREDRDLVIEEGFTI